MLSKAVLSGLAFALFASPSRSAPVEAKSFSFDVQKREGSSFSRRALTGTAPANQAVIADFLLGSNAQKIPFSIDSGSSFTYVVSTLDKNPSDTNGLPALYNPNTSTTYHDFPADNFDCGNGDVVCRIGYDNFTLGGLTASGETFGVASHVQSGIFGSGQSGTMGFGRQSGAPSSWLPRDTPFWYRVGAKLTLPYLWATNLYDYKNGTFDFGFIDTKKYKGDITWAALDTSISNWNFKMTGYQIGSGQVKSVSTFVGVVDTGGPNIGLPAAIVKPYFASFGGFPAEGNSHNFPCSAYPPPNLTLRLASGGTLVLNGTFLAYGNQSPWGNGTCGGRLDDSSQDAYNIGACMLDQKFVVFDHQNSRLGFANKAVP